MCILTHHTQTSVILCLITLIYIKGFPVAQLVKNPPSRRETQIPFLGQEDPLEKGMATHSNIPA